MYQFYLDEKERELDSLYIEKFYNRLLIPEKTLAIEEKYNLVFNIILDMKRYDEMEINNKNNDNKNNENKDNEQIKLLEHITTMSEDFVKIYNKNRSEYDRLYCDSVPYFIIEHYKKTKRLLDFIDPDPFRSEIQKELKEQDVYIIEEHPGIQLNKKKSTSDQTS